MNSSSDRLRHLKLALALAACAVSQIACASTISSTAESLANAGGDRASILSSYDQINTAFTENHLNRLALQLACDYVQTDSKGHVLNRAALIKKLQDERNAIRTIKTDYWITTMTPQPKGLLVEMRMHSAGTGEKRVLFFKVQGTFTNDQIVRDLWVNTPAGWRIQSRQVILDESHQQAA